MKNILLLIHDDAGQEARLQAALDVTRAVEGHLTCLDVSIIPPLPEDPYGMSSNATVIAFERDSEAANRARIEPRIAKEGVPWTWIETTSYLAPALERETSLADLIVVNRHLDSFPLPEMKAIAGLLVVKSGKPILAVPERVTGFRAGGGALVAWDGSPESASALTAAVPLLALADAVTIVSIEDASIKAPAEEAAVYLSRHDIHADVAHEATGGRRSGDVLLANATSGAFDYLVMGGFGHSRFRESLFGGVTRTMLRECPIPLFLAH
jgi:nucleotide-binding universal stress UspA family protein